MTIPEEPPGGAREPHLSRPEPGGTGPDRSGGTDEDAVQREADAAKLNESVAQVMRKAYDVITRNAQDVREAAARFRDGKYPASDVPDDLKVMAERLIDLARQVSATTLDICGELVKKSTKTQDEGDATADVPPFRAGAGGPAPAGGLRVKVQFEGRAARCQAVSVRPPQNSAQPADIYAAPLRLKSGGGTIEDIGFGVDLSANGGLVVTVRVPETQPPGVYSGLVYAKNDEAPLGYLTVEVPA